MDQDVGRSSLITSGQEEFIVKHLEVRRGVDV